MPINDKVFERELLRMMTEPLSDTSASGAILPYIVRAPLSVVQAAARTERDAAGWASLLSGF